MVTTILLTNDDGIYSPGIQILEDILLADPEVDLWVIAPTSDQSRKGTALTTPSNEIKVHKIDNQKYSVDGTPSDCIFVGIDKLITTPPDLTISGLALSISYHTGSTFLSSGTIAAGIASTTLNVPAIVLTQIDPKKSIENYDVAYSTLKPLIKYLINLINDYHDVLHNTILNVNIPYHTNNELSLSAKGFHEQYPFYSKNIDIDTYKYAAIREYLTKGSDSLEMLNQGYITLTPLTIDLTDYNNFPYIEEYLANTDYCFMPI